MSKKQNNSWAVQFNYKGDFPSAVRGKWLTERWFQLNDRESAEKYLATQKRWFKRVGRFPDQYDFRIVPDYLEAFDKIKGMSLGADVIGNGQKTLADTLRGAN